MIQLLPSHLKIVEQILGQYVPDCEVRVFGSRVKGTTKRYADLDLTVLGGLEHAQLDQLIEAFIESDLPFRVDILDWMALSDDFRAVIEARYEVIQEATKMGTRTSIAL